MTNSVASSVAAFVALLASGLTVSIAAQRVRVPPAVLLVVVGAIFGSVWHVAPPFSFGPVLFVVFLPPLIFEAAWNIDLAEIRRAAGTIVTLALPGTLFSAFAIAGALSAVRALDFPVALLFGAIVSATDPVAVVAVFRNVKAPARLKAIVEAESLANDGVAVILYGIALALVGGGAVAWYTGVLQLMLSIGGGILVGALCAIPSWLALRLITFAEYEVAGTVALAYIAYLIADRLGVSGIFATTAAAIVLRALLVRRANLNNRNDVDVFWNATAFIANAVVFLATGLLIDLPRAVHEPLLVITAVVATIGSRLALAFVAARDHAGRTTFVLSGMRGALPLALALALPKELPHRAEIIDGVFAVVLVTLVVQGAPLEAVVRRFYGPLSDRS